MAFDLNPLALANAPLLRLIAQATTHEIATTDGLATAAGRDPSNVRKSLKALQAAGLIHEDPLTNGLTDDGTAQLAALDRAADPTAGGGLTARHDELEPHPLQPRKDYDSDDAQAGLDELRESALTRTDDGEHRGLLHPIIVRPQPTPGKWWIVDGERRWRAIGQAIWDGDWPEDRRLPITVRQVSDREHLMLALTANVQRADMKSIEEGAAFAAAVHDFGATTEQLAAELGKSQRYVQQRIALLKLSDTDQDRMRLPRDHPDHLSFKAARALTQTPRGAQAQPQANPWAHSGYADALLSRLCATYGDTAVASVPDMSEQITAAHWAGTSVEDALAEIAERNGLTFRDADDPGSPPPADAEPDPVPFGDRLTDRQALMFVEIVAKADRDPAADPALASESYTQVQNVPVHGVAAELVAMNAIGFRQRGSTVFVRPRLHSTGAKAWLQDIGFDHRRDDVLHEMRVRAEGLDKANAARADGVYLTPWLNPAGCPLTDGGEGMMSGPKEAFADYAAERRAGGDQAEPEQPELIEATAEERAARIAAENERHADARARAAADAYARQIGDWMALARARDAADYLNPPPAAGPAITHDGMALALIRAVSTGRTGEAGAILATLTLRLGPNGAGDLMARVWREQTIADAGPEADPDADPEAPETVDHDDEQAAD